MIAVALVDLQREFGVSLATSSWLISGFYLTASVGQPLMGRLADRYGPRRVFSAGLALVFVTCALVLVAPGFGWVVAARVLQAIGTSVGFPAGLALIRRLAGGRPPAGTLGVISAANSASAAFGPVLGGVLVAALGWRGIFAVNLPMAGVGLWLARRWLPADPPSDAPADTRAFLRELDLPGVALFATTITAVLGFLLSGDLRLLPVVPVSAALFAWRELRAPAPFLDLRALAAQRSLVGVLGQQAAVQCVFYLIFFSLPQWLEQVRGYPAAATGLLMLPIAALGVLLTPLAARLVRRFGAGLSVLVGCVGLLAGGADRYRGGAVPDRPLRRRDPVHRAARGRLRRYPQHRRTAPGGGVRRRRRGAARGRRALHARPGWPAPGAGPSRRIPRRAVTRRGRRQDLAQTSASGPRGESGRVGSCPRVSRVSRHGWSLTSASGALRSRPRISSVTSRIRSMSDCVRSVRRFSSTCNTCRPSAWTSMSGS